ncbi:Methylisocitrate lyase [Novipirellula galeiformis]|uniref:2-methylisocitrate lyase n=1 Tax=Novipirellula galeiformis TaxID=2528004 RepID=A0A5C6CMR6_9BACT|nr:methylisocitrate lyase [Novipirellula galeiformis]TWU25375.1 Methylisocitrate lyase [Novipirellula galeiformis]
MASPIWAAKPLFRELAMSASQPSTAGQRFRWAVDRELPLQVPGAVNAMCALLAQRAGFRALYLSGSGVASASHGLPDLGVTTLADVLDDARRITSVTDLPLLVDADTGWGSALMIERTVRELIRGGVAGMHLEDQVDAKRCGHRPGKQLVSVPEMNDRLKAALDARSDSSFVIMARTDAASVEGIDAAIERATQYVETGVDMIFAEALTSLDEYRQFTAAVEIPVLANITEFGRTPLFSVDELRDAGIRLVLYPLTAYRAMNAVAARVYETLRGAGTQIDLIDSMQTREELYEVLDYYAKELSEGKSNRK